MNKALIISGGGSKGAFAVGVIQDLVRNYLLQFDVAIGSSTGALIAPLAIMNELETLEKLYTTVTTGDLIEKYNIGARLNETSLFTANGLGKKVKEIYNDDFYNRLIQAGKRVYLTTTCLQTEALVVFTTDPHPKPASYYTLRKIENADHFRRAIMASASQPVFMPPVSVNKNIPGEQFPHYQFVDGGVKEYAGVGIALDAGATELFTILLAAKSASPTQQVYTDLFSILLQTVSTFITDVSENDVYAPKQNIFANNYLNIVKEKMKGLGVTDSTINNYFKTSDALYSRFLNTSLIKWHIIQPDNPLGGGPGGLDFNPAEMKNMLAAGKITLESYVAHLHPGDIDWA